MLRIFLTYVLPLIVPFLVYELWRMFAPPRLGGKGTGEPDPVERLPWPWLAGTGVVLMLITVFSFVLFSNWEDGTEYHPPHLKDGEVVPGRFTRPGEG